MVVVEMYKNLGVHLDNLLNWMHNMEVVERKGEKQTLIFGV